MDKDKPVCYWCGDASDFTDPNPKFRYVGLKADRAVNKKKNDFDCGMIAVSVSLITIIKFKLSIHLKSRQEGAIDFLRHEAWNTPLEKRNGVFKCRAFIF